MIMPLKSQSEFICGILSPHTATSTNPDSIAYDRFGNTYDITGLLEPDGAELFQDLDEGYFKTTIYGGLPLNVKASVKKVLQDISNIIIRREGCGDEPYQKVKLQIAWLDFSSPDPAVLSAMGLSGLGLQPGAVGTSSPYYSPSNDINGIDCRILQECPAFIKINGGKVAPFNASLFDGFILLNSNILGTSNCPTISWNTDYTSTNFPCQMDVYSVTLHEVLHVLGFASRYPSTQFMTLWDRSLRVVDDFIAGGGGLNPQEVFVNNSDCTLNCWDYGVNLTDIIQNSCTNNNTLPDIVIGDGAIAPVMTIPNSTPQAATNFLSHLNTNCNGAADYVMKYSISEGQYTREITLAEMNILCELGYQISSGNFTCSGCYNIANNDVIRDDEISCCFRGYSLCKGEVLNISSLDLLCNDLTNGNIHEVTDMWFELSLPGNQPQEVTIEQDVNNFDWHISVSADFNANFMYLGYTTNGCDCRPHNSRFIIFIERNCPECIYPEILCDNLVCSGDFEGFTATVPTPIYFFGGPYSTQGGNIGTPDIYASTDGGRSLHLDNGSNNQELASFTLAECIKPGCSLLLSMDIASPVTPIGSVIEVWGSHNAPCPALPGVDALANTCNITTICANNEAYLPYCIGSFTTSTSFPVFSPIDVYAWPNLTTEDICFLTFIPTISDALPGVVIDNITVTQQCTDPAFELSGNCPDFHFISASIPEDMTHLWSFGDGSTSSDPVPDHEYAENGTFTITHTVTDQCGNTASATETVTIDCLPEYFLCPCPPGGYKIFNPSNPGGTINLTDTDLPVNWLAGACVAIYGNLLINLPPNSVYNITYCNFKMQPGSSITIPSGVTVRMDNTFLEGCETMWRSIVVEDGGVLSAEICVFKDAEYTIDAKNGSWINLADNTFLRNYVSLLDGAGQSTITLGAFSGNTFHCDDCSTANPMLPPTTIGLIPTPGIRSYAGVLIDNNAGLTLGTGTGVETNIFRNMANGIVADRVNLTVENCRFENMLTGGGYDANNQSGYGIMAKGHSYFLQQTGLGKYNNIATFHNCQNSGIYTYRTNLNVTECKMTQMNNGITVNQSPHVDIVISNNNISATKRGIACINTDEAGILDINHNDILINSAQLNNNVDVNGIYIGETGGASSINRSIKDNTNIEILNRGNGIHLLNVNGISVTDNTIHFANSTTAQGTGILMDGSDDNHIQCNSITGSNVSTQTTAYSQKTGAGNTIHCNTTGLTRVGFRFTGMCVGTDLATNTIGRHQDGLLMTASAAFGDNADENVQEQNGNLWVGDGDTDYNEVEDYSDKAAKHEGGPPQINFSRFEINTTDPPLFPPSIQSGSPWFSQEEGTSMVCIPGQDCMPNFINMNRTISSLEKALVTDEMNVLQYDEGVKWEAQKKVYEKILQEPDLVLQDAELMTFKSTQEDLPVGKLTSIAVENTNALKLSEQEIALLEQKNITIEDIQTDIKILESQIYPDMPETTLLAVKAQINTLNDLLKTAVTDKESMTTGIESAKATEISALIPENNLVVASEIFEINEKTVNSVLFDILSSALEYPTQEQIDVLIPIANQCPLSGGKAVLKARSLLSIVNDLTYDDDDICEQAGVSYLTATESNNQDMNNGQSISFEKLINVDSMLYLELFPVPSDEKLVVACNIMIDHISIRDMLGRIVIVKNIISSDDFIEIDVSDLIAGIYTCDISIRGKGSVKRVIIISH
jgi:PKD repeat protein